MRAVHLKILSLFLFIAPSWSCLRLSDHGRTLKLPNVPHVQTKLDLFTRNSRRVGTFGITIKKTTDASLSYTKPIVLSLVGGGTLSKKVTATKSKPSSGPTGAFRWFRPTSTRKERALAGWLLFWNGIALVDALMFTFRAKQNLDGYLVGEWGPHTLAQTRMLANCQLALIATSCLVACIADERALKIQFKILILATLGAFRAVAAGVKEGTIKAPWKTGYAAVMTAPPLLLLAYFAYVF